MGCDCAACAIAHLAERVEKALRGAAIWDEVKDRLQDSALAFSGGQMQRLCIARALATTPEILLFDEPTSALDPIATAKIEELITELRQQVTILIVTHNMQQAARVSDFTAFMYLGELVEVDEASRIFTNPSGRRPKTTSPVGTVDIACDGNDVSLPLNPNWGLCMATSDGHRVPSKRTPPRSTRRWRHCGCRPWRWAASSSTRWRGRCVPC